MLKQIAMVVIVCFVGACTRQAEPGATGPQGPVGARSEAGSAGHSGSEGLTGEVAAEPHAGPQGPGLIATPSALPIQTNPGSREAPSPPGSGLVGKWAGRGCQGDGACWTIQVDISAIDEGKPAGVVAYPSLGCDAHLEFDRWESHVAVFRERYTRLGHCVPDGWLRLHVVDPGKLRYEWAWPNGRTDAVTMLERVK